MADSYGSPVNAVPVQPMGGVPTRGQGAGVAVIRVAAGLLGGHEEVSQVAGGSCGVDEGQLLHIKPPVIMMCSTTYTTRIPRKMTHLSQVSLGHSCFIWSNICQHV